MPEIKLILDKDVLDKYDNYYFKMHPKAKKRPIDRPIHPSINLWMTLPRIQMNQLKQKWKDFCSFWIRDLGYENILLDNFHIEFITYMPTKRRADADNYVPKFILDAFTETGFIVDDDGKHLKSLTLKVDYDKDWPRTEITIKY